MRYHISIDSTVGVGSIKWKDEWGRTVGEWGEYTKGSSTNIILYGPHILEGGITLDLVLWRWGHTFFVIEEWGANINVSNNDMASGCWIIRLQEADHPEQSLLLSSYESPAL